MFYRVMYKIGTLKDFADAVWSCGSNYYTCGETFGKLYSTMTLFTVFNFPTTWDIEDKGIEDFPEFVVGVGEGLDSDVLRGILGDVTVILDALKALQRGGVFEDL
jgi:hypothetical protein